MERRLRQKGRARRVNHALQSQSAAGFILHRGAIITMDRAAAQVEALAVRGEHIVGYTLLNDVSAREVYRERGQWLLNKSLDSFAPLGPWLVTRDEVEEPQNLRIQGFLNGMVVQDSNTRLMIFPIDRIVSFISERFTLEPGDVISTGTPEGVGGMRNPPIFLKPGDVVQVVVEKIGTLENPVIHAPAS